MSLYIYSYIYLKYANIHENWALRAIKIIYFIYTIYQTYYIYLIYSIDAACTVYNTIYIILDNIYIYRDIL